VARGEQDVLGLEVAVHHPGAVRVRQRICELTRQTHDVIDGQRTFAHQPGAEALSLDERHRVKGQASDRARGVDGDVVRVLQPGRKPDLALEALRGEPGGEVRVEHLDHDLAVEPDVARDEDPRHAATAELALQDIGIPEHRLQPPAQRRAVRIHAARLRGRVMVAAKIDVGRESGQAPTRSLA
jgi:hypothetical protein